MTTRQQSETVDPADAEFLSEDQIAFYAREGYLLLPRFLSDREMAGVKHAFSDKVSEIADELFMNGLVDDKFEAEPFQSRLARLFDHLTDQDFLKFGRSWRDRHPGYFDLMSNSRILDVIESLVGGEIFANPVYNARPKVPRVAAGAVPWHQDKSYWPGANANPVITVWIPLVDANLENGCLHIWPRTHNKEVLSYGHETYSGTSYTEIDAKHMREARIVSLPMESGGAILFNDRCVHMSTPNNSNTVRWSVDLRYQPTDQDPMVGHGIGFLARSRKSPERVAKVEDWIELRPEHDPG